MTRLSSAFAARRGRWRPTWFAGRARPTSARRGCGPIATAGASAGSSTRSLRRRSSICRCRSMPGPMFCRSSTHGRGACHRRSSSLGRGTDTAHRDGCSGETPACADYRLSARGGAEDPALCGGDRCTRELAATPVWMWSTWRPLLERGMSWCRAISTPSPSSPADRSSNVRSRRSCADWPECRTFSTWATAFCRRRRWSMWHGLWRWSAGELDRKFASREGLPPFDPLEGTPLELPAFSNESGWSGGCPGRVGDARLRHDGVWGWPHSRSDTSA